jgi:hypothetical protein
MNAMNAIRSFHMISVAIVQMNERWKNVLVVSVTGDHAAIHQAATSAKSDTRKGVIAATLASCRKNRNIYET